MEKIVVCTRVFKEAFSREANWSGDGSGIKYYVGSSLPRTDYLDRPGQGPRYARRWAIARQIVSEDENDPRVIYVLQEVDEDTPCELISWVRYSSRLNPLAYGSGTVLGPPCQYEDDFGTLQADRRASETASKLLKL